MKTMVYHFQVRDPATDQVIVPKLKSPLTASRTSAAVRL
jgi:hypothetical protein